LYGDGLHQRDWLHADDCCRAIRAVLRHGAIGRRYLAGAGNQLTNLAVAEQIGDLVDQRLNDGGGRRELIRHVADRPGHDRRYAVDSTPLRKELGWQPMESFSTGLAATVAWYLEHGEWTAAATASLAARDAGGPQG
jgi:dTDP-glucose 4,6-dehydratase